MTEEKNDPIANFREQLSQFAAACGISDPYAEAKVADATEPKVVVGGKSYEELLAWVKEETEEIGSVLIDENKPRISVNQIKAAHPSNFERVTENSEKDEPELDFNTDLGLILARKRAEKIIKAVDEAEKDLDTLSIYERLDDLACQLFEYQVSTFSWTGMCSDFLHQVRAKATSPFTDEITFPAFYRAVESVKNDSFPKSDIYKAAENWLTIHE